MSNNYDDKRFNKPHHNEDDDADGGSSGQGTKSGGVEFKEFVGSNQFLRDDLLSPEEKKRLLVVHSQANEQNVKKQKARRDEYKALKEGRTHVNDFRQGRGMGAGGDYKAHFLSNKAQFSGIDSKVTPVANDHVSETNNDKKEELTYQNRLENRPQYASAPPKPNPFNR